MNSRSNLLFNFFVLAITLFFLSLKYTLAETPTKPPSNHSEITNGQNWIKLNDSDWLKKVSHMLLQQLLDEEIDMVCKQLRLSYEVQLDLSKLNEVITKRDLYGRESSRASEMEANQNSGSALSDKFEKKYQTANLSCLELVKKLRLEMGNKQEDFIQWVLERNYIRNVVMDASFKKELENEDDLNNKTVQTIEASPRFKAYKENKILKLSSSVNANDYFSQHELSLRKRVEYQILLFKAHEFKGSKDWHEYKDKLKRLSQEIATINQ